MLRSFSHVPGEVDKVSRHGADPVSNTLTCGNSKMRALPIDSKAGYMAKGWVYYKSVVLELIDDEIQNKFPIKVNSKTVS